MNKLNSLEAFAGMQQVYDGRFLLGNRSRCCQRIIMQSWNKLLCVALLPAAFLLTACQEKEGPAEKAGKELDKAASAIGNQLESVGEQIQGAVSSAK